MPPQLTEGALATIMQGGDFVNAVVQVLSIKKMNTGSGQPEKDRYRAFLSDGKYSVSFAMMTAPVYAKAGTHGISKFSIIRIARFITSVVNNTEGRDNRVLLILDLEILADGDDVKEKIGNPVPHTDAVADSKANRTASSSSHNGTSYNARNGTSNEGPAAKMPKLMTSSSSRASTSNARDVTLAGHVTHPISSLSPYHNKWIIKARVTNKSAIRTWANSKGEGKLFSMDLVDESGEIRCTGFKDLVDKYYDMIQVDKVYYISKCQLKPCNKQFCSLKNDYEMSMVSETIVEECNDDDDLSTVPQTMYNFVPISKIAELEPSTMIDIIGVAKATGDLQTFQAKSTGRELKKKEVQLVDQSKTIITLTLWGSEAENFDGSGNPVVVLRGVKISEFGGGKTLSAVAGTSFRINPDLKECFRLKGWYESEGSNIDASDLSSKSAMGGNLSTPWMCFKEVADQQFGSINTDKGDYYQIKVTILLLRTENCIYKACPSTDCNKKLLDQGNGMFRCEKCNREYENFKYRLLSSMNVGDWSGNQWVSMFSDESEKVVGMTAQEAGELQDSDNASFIEAMEKAHFKQFTLKCRAKMETYNDEQRLKTVAIRVDPINHDDYNAYLINSINRFVTY